MAVFFDAFSAEEARETGFSSAGADFTAAFFPEADTDFFSGFSGTVPTAFFSAESLVFPVFFFFTLSGAAGVFSPAALFFAAGFFSGTAFCNDFFFSGADDFAGTDALPDADADDGLEEAFFPIPAVFAGTAFTEAVFTVFPEAGFFLDATGMATVFFTVFFAAPTAFFGSADGAETTGAGFFFFSGTALTEAFTATGFLTATFFSLLTGFLTAAFLTETGLAAGFFADGTDMAADFFPAGWIAERFSDLANFTLESPFLADGTLFGTGRLIFSVSMTTGLDMVFLTFAAFTTAGFLTFAMLGTADFAVAFEGVFRGAADCNAEEAVFFKTFF